MSKIKSSKWNKITLASVFTVAGVLYCLISLVNHYLFKTYALDLGLYTHAMYDYAHFRIDDCGMFKMQPQSILSDHFDLYLVLLSPLIFVFGSYTLLIVQIVAVLLGGWGVYKLIGLYTENEWLPVLASATFFFSFGIIHPLAFDYHSNVVSAMMLPWLLYYLKKRQFKWASFLFVLIAIGKENMSLWLLFVAVALMWDYRKDKQALWHLVAYAVFAVVYFFVINMIVMPQLGGNGSGFARYAHLGSNYAEIFRNLVSHPWQTVEILFSNTSGFERNNGIKAEFYICALATGMVFTVLKPNYLIMLIPLIAQKMLAADGTFWGISYQYSVEFMPILVVSAFLVFSRIEKQLWQLVLAVVLLLSTVLTTFYTIGVPKSEVKLDQLCVYQKRHYEQKNFDVHYAYEVIEMIPEGASVTAITPFVPHLAMRDTIRSFGYIRRVDTEYVLMTKPYFEYERDGVLVLNNRDEYETVATDGTIYLLKRKAP